MRKSPSLRSSFKWPRIIKIASQKCPLCDYTSVSNTARHFRSVHPTQLRQFLTGNIKIPGITKRRNVSGKCINSVLSQLNYKKIGVGNNNNNYSHSRKSTTTPSILIKSTKSNCPLCKYNFTSTCNAARHFQSQHKTEFQKVMNGTGSYPGISKKKFQQEKKDASDVPDPVQKTNISTLEPIATEIVQMKTTEKYLEQIDQTRSEFISTVYPKKSIQDSDDDVDGDGVDVDSDVDVGEEDSSKVKYDIKSKPERESEEESEINGSLLPPILKANLNDDVDPNSDFSATFIACLVSGCQFSTDSLYSFRMHSNFHQMLNSMPSFVKTIVEASGNVDYVMKMELKPPLEKVSGKEE